MSNMVYQQFPVTSSAVDPVSGQVNSSAANASLQQLPVSVSDQQLVGFENSGVHGMLPNDQRGQFGMDLTSHESHQFLLPDRQVREAPNSAGMMQSSISSKRKNPMEPLSVNRAPEESFMPNKRFGQMGHREAVTPNSRSAQMLSKFNSPKAQGLPTQNKRGVHSEPRAGKTGLQQSSAARNPAKVQPYPRVQSDSNESVRSKMRESLAGALSLVSQTSSKPTSEGPSSQSEAIASPVQSQDAQPASSAGATHSASGEDVPSKCGQGQSEIAFDVNSGQFPDTLTCGGNEFELGKIPDEDIPFTDNFFVKDELLQGNGLSWVLDPFPEAAEKEIHCSENESFGHQKEKSRRNVTSQSPEILASKIEAELYKLYSGANKKYKEKGRSLLFNLKDRNNPELRERVMSGDIPPERLCSMTAEELASKELSEWRIAKAEELAQMVVLPDTEVDVRRLVKKTHKGEYQVDMDYYSRDSVDTPLKTSSVTSSQLKQSEEFKDRVNVDGERSKLENQEKLYTLTIPPNEESDLMQGLMVDDVMKATCDLPSIVSLDEFMQSLDSEPPFENLSADAVKTTPISDRDYSDQSDHKDPSPRGSELSKSHSADVASEKHNKVDAVEFVSNSNRIRPIPMGEHVWEGLVQLNIATSSSIVGIFKCGEKAPMKEWPNLLEVKGRVRVDAFEKFLQELPMSRSRAVMAVHFVCSVEATEVEHASLQEAVESYILDERVGFVEPAPGIELYLCPSHKKTLEMLDKILSKVHIQELNMIDYGLIGIVVWRKANTISPNSSHSKHGSKREQFSRRHQERDHKMDVKLTPISKTSTSMEQLNSIPKSLHNDDDDVDLPPGFGPPAARDDDLPEFDFSSGTGQRQLHSNGIPPLGLRKASAHTHQFPPADRMRVLVHRYGQSMSDVPPGAVQHKGGVGGAIIKSWKDDDDDDIPEWQPQLPHQQSMLRPHTNSYQHLPIPMAASPMLSSQPFQTQIMNRGPQNVHQSLNQGSWGVRPGVGQFYGAPHQGHGQQGTGWRRDGPNRGL